MFSCTSNEADLAGHAGCRCHRPEVQALTRRIGADLSRRGFVAGVGVSVASLGLPKFANAQSAPAPSTGQPSRPTLFTNFRLFDGSFSTLRDGLRLLVEGNRIKAVAQGNPAAPDGAHVIDCGGRVLMPGLIDAHWHSIFAALPLSALMAADVGYIYLAASAEAERTLMRGFTTVRDLGGPAFALKQAIDEGLVPGPRIYPSGAMITATGGHGDLRPLSDVPSVAGTLSRVEQSGASIIADGPDAVRLRVREQLSRLHRRSNLWEAAAYQHRAARWTQPASPSPNCARGSKRPKTGPPTSRCTPIHRRRSSGRLPPGPGASSMVI
jgi:Amidohydrolase family